RHKSFFHHIVIEHWMAAVLNDETQRVVQLWSAITKEPRRFSQRANDVQNCNGGCRLLDQFQFTQSFVTQFLEKLVFELARAFVGAKDFCFDLLQFWRDETFAAYRGLLACIMRGHVRKVRFRYFDEIA